MTLNRTLEPGRGWEPRKVCGLPCLISESGSVNGGTVSHGCVSCVLRVAEERGVRDTITEGMRALCCTRCGTSSHTGERYTCPEHTPKASPMPGDAEAVREETARCINIVGASPADLAARRWIMRAIVGGEVVGEPSGPSSGAARASSACPICGANTPHPHVASEIEAWATNQVAAWGYEVRLSRLGTAKAVEVHECAGCGHERTGDLRDVAAGSRIVKRWMCDECEQRRQPKVGAP